MDGLGAYLEIFKQTHQKRPEAKVSLGGHLNISKYVHTSKLHSRIILHSRLTLNTIMIMKERSHKCVLIMVFLDNCT